MCPSFLKCPCLPGLEALTLLFGYLLETGFRWVALQSWNNSIYDQAVLKRSACLFLRVIECVSAVIKSALWPLIPALEKQRQADF